MVMIPAVLILLVSALQSASQNSAVWITPAEQNQVVQSVFALLPAGWTIVRQELNQTPADWFTTDRRSFEIEGKNGEQVFHIWILPNDWIGIRRAKPKRPRWGAEVFRTAQFKAIIDADYPVYHALEGLQKGTVSMVNGAVPIQAFRDRMDEVDSQTQSLVNRLCNDRACRDEAAYSLIVLGVPARAIFLDCAEHGFGEPQESCVSVLKMFKESESRQVLERVVSSPESSSAVQKAAAYSLMEVGDASSGPALLKALRNASNVEALWPILDGLGRFHYESAAPEILRRMEMEPLHFNLEAVFAKALASLRYSPAIPAIQMRCRSLQLSSEWILEQAKVWNSVDLNVPEISLLRLTAPWGQPSDGVRLLLVAPATVPETGRTRIAALMENGSNREQNSLLMSFFGADVIVDGKLYPHPLSIWDGNAMLRVNAVNVRAIDLPEESLDGRIHTVQIRAANAVSNILTLRLPKP